MRVASEQQLLQFATYGPIGVNSEGSLYYLSGLTRNEKAKKFRSSMIYTGMRTSRATLESLVKSGKLIFNSERDVFSLPGTV